MKCLLVISCLVALTAATPGYLGVSHLSYSAATPLAYSAVVAPAAVTSQHHAQDALGQYSYGYQGDTSAKEEVRTADGITRGGYSYLDGHGLVQSASYVSDPFNGFRVAATNLPQGPVAPAYAAAYATPVAVAAGVPLDTPEVAAAKAAHFQAHASAKAQLLGRKKRSPGYLSAAPVVHYGYSAVAAPTYGYSAVTHAAAPAAFTYTAPLAVPHAGPSAVVYTVPGAVTTQHHAQDALGQYSYGYADGNSVKQETRAVDGSTHGAYSYVDGNGIVQSVKYHADSLGFRVAATNLPVGPA